MTRACLHRTACIAPHPGTYPYHHHLHHLAALLQSIDPALSRWTNMLVLMIYPVIFHALAFAFTFFHTRPKSFWRPVEDFLHRRFPKTFRRRENMAHADPRWRLSMGGYHDADDDDDDDDGPAGLAQQQAPPKLDKPTSRTQV